MNEIRTIVLIILWLGVMAGAGAAVLDSDNRVLPLLGVFILGFLALKLGTTDRPSRKRKFRYKSKFTAAEIAQMRRDYDRDRKHLALTHVNPGPYDTEGAVYFDSFGFKRDASTDAYLYMNRTNTPNGDVFADLVAGKEVEYDGGPAYVDKDGNFWMDE